MQRNPNKKSQKQNIWEKEETLIVHIGLNPNLKFWREKRFGPKQNTKFTLSHHNHHPPQTFLPVPGSI
jgi:hypothetical protein